MVKNSVCAVIVTYHPSDGDRSNLDVLAPQVEKIVVVDNGSSSATLEKLASQLKSLDGHLLENGDNLGIAKALNVGVEWAIAEGYSWIVLFDQDSRVTDGFVETMLSDLATQSAKRPLAQIVPQYREPVTGEVANAPLLTKSGDGVLISITSGSMFPVSTFARVGLFREELFIYCVDDDYSLRLNQKGLSIGISSAVLLHRGGRVTSFRLFGRTLETPNYSPIVLYYWGRNRIWLVKNYGRYYPPLILTSIRSLLGFPIKIGIGEKDRRKKISMFALGIFHGLLGKMGKKAA